MDLKILLEITQTVESEFGELSEEELNKKTSAKEWSIGQCLDHIIISSKTYLPILMSIKNGTHRSTFWETNNMLTDYTGRRMISTLGTDTRKKFKAPRIFTPSKSTIKTDIIIKFRDHQEQLFELFKILSEEKYSEKVITSPIASLITLNIKDVISIIIVHEQRHVQQAISIKNKLGIESKKNPRDQPGETYPNN